VGSLRFARGVLSCSARPDRAVPLTPLSLQDRLEASQPRARSRSPRPLSPPFMKIGQRSRPRMPSIDDGHSRACVNRCRSRVRSRDVSATVRPSAPLRLPLPKRCFRAYAQGFDRLDPRPRLSPRFALFTRSADRRFSGPDCRPSTSATATLFFRGVGTPTSTRFSHCAKKVRTLAGP